MTYTVRPDTKDYDSYYGRYISLVQDGDLLRIYADQLDNLTARLTGLSEEVAGFRYEEEKWSVKQVLGHIADTERVFSYRLLCIARGEKAALPTFDQDEYVAQGHFNERSIGDLVAEFSAIRQSSMALLKSLTDVTLHNTGTVKNHPTTALAIVCIIAGHTQHHLNILNDKYHV